MKQRVTILEASVPRLPAGVKLRFDEQREQWIMLAPERVFVPDEIAIEVIKRCDGEATVAAIADDLAKTFAAPRDEILKDVSELLQGLVDKGVITA